MALRRKERPPTLEEIKEKILESTAHSWLHGEPVCGFTPFIDQGKIIPLPTKLEHSVIAIFFLDAADYTTDRVMENLNQWTDRYRKLQWMPIFAFRSKYLFLKQPRFFDIYRHFPFFQAMPIFIDEQNTWFDFVQIEGPTLALFQNGNLLFKVPLQPNFSEALVLAELKLQECLRADNPGLPLLEVSSSDHTLPIDQKSILASEINLGGYWVSAGKGITTDDPNAKLNIPFSGTHLRMIAITDPQARENAKAQIFLDDLPLPVALRGNQVHAGDKGHTILEINKHTGIFEILKSDTVIQGNITVKFLNTLENTVIIYELRIA